VDSFSAAATPPAEGFKASVWSTQSTADVANHDTLLAPHLRCRAAPLRTRLRRRSAQCGMRPIRWGSLMRHFLRCEGCPPLSVTRLASSVVVTPRPLVLIPPPGAATLLPPALLGAGFTAVPLTTVTDRADRNQATAAHTGKEPVVRPHRQPSGCPGAGRRSGLRRYWGAGNAAWKRRAPAGEAQGGDRQSQ
jgi:hypothetical protein